MHSIDRQLQDALYERDYWIDQYHNKDTSTIIQKLNQKLEAKDKTIKHLRETIQYLENQLKIVPFKTKN